MTLDVEVPPPPSLHGPQSRGEYEAVVVPDAELTDDYRREEIRTVLRDGAWHDAFAQWAERTYLTFDEFETVLELELIDEFDFYWVPATGDVGYRTPTVPPEARDRFPDDEASGVDEELDELGRTVSDVLESDAFLTDGDDLPFEFFGEEMDREAELEQRARVAELDAEAEADAVADADGESASEREELGERSRDRLDDEPTP